MPNVRSKRFTIYDAMEAKGVFDLNPANMTAEQSVGGYQKADYPKMLYSPKGETKVTVPAEVIVTPFGPKEVGQQSEIIHVVVKDLAEEKKYLGLGWHTHPARAVHAGGGAAPAISSEQRIKDLEAQIAALEAEKDEAETGTKPLGVRQHAAA